jgi:hypothetical protein
MGRVKPLDLYKKDFPSLFGLEFGEYYETLEDFFLEVIDSYRVSSEKTGIKYLKPEWSRIRSIQGDLITVNHSGAYLIPKGEEFFIPCKPEFISKKEEPSFDKFPINFLKKIGKDVVEGHSMGFEDRKKIIFTRIL